MKKEIALILHPIMKLIFHQFSHQLERSFNLKILIFKLKNLLIMKNRIKNYDNLYFYTKIIQLKIFIFYYFSKTIFKRIHQYSINFN